MVNKITEEGLFFIHRDIIYTHQRRKPILLIIKRSSITGCFDLNPPFIFKQHALTRLPQRFLSKWQDICNILIELP